MEAVLLGLLAEGPAHGYDLKERMPTLFPLPDNLPDVSTIYRSLADLEAQGAIRSSWVGGAGGGRKVYELTEAGEEILSFWVKRFEEEQAGVARFLERMRVTAQARREVTKKPRTAARKRAGGSR